MALLLQCLWAFLATLGFGIVFNIHGKPLFAAAVGGALSWFVYVGLEPFFIGDIPRYFIATLAVALYAEVMARTFKTPATVYLAASLIPLVPGGGIYSTMELCVQGNVDAAIQTGLHTLGIAGALAMGIIMISSTLRIWMIVHKQVKKRLKSS